MTAVRSITRRPLNPVMAREIKVRMRGRRGAVIISLYLAILTFVLYTIYAGIQRTTLTRFGGQAVFSSVAGRSIFQTLLFMALALVCFIVPGLSAGAVAGERERQTLVPLQITLLRPLSILLGKLGASIAFVVLLVIATLPLMAVAFVLGGVDATSVVKGVLMVLVVAFVIAAMSMGCSSVFRRVQSATVASYGLVLLLIFGTPMIYGAQVVLGSHQGVRGHPTKAVLVLNPFLATADVVGDSTSGGSNQPLPFNALRDSVHGSGSYSQLAIARARAGQQQLFSSSSQQPPSTTSTNDIHIAFWLRSLAAYAVLAALALLVAARRLRTPARA